MFPIAKGSVKSLLAKGSMNGSVSQREYEVSVSHSVCGCL